MTVGLSAFYLGLQISLLFLATPVWGNAEINPIQVQESKAEDLNVDSNSNSNSNSNLDLDLDLDPQIIKESPVLQRWQRGIPNLLSDINNDPSFRTRIRMGYSAYPDSAGGVYLGFEDLFIDSTRLTIRGDYQTTFNGQYRSYGTDLQYHLRPMGSYINIATVTGYRYLENHTYSTSGINLGIKLLLMLSRSGGADISLTQSWVAPLSTKEAGFTTLSFGYAIAPELRLSTEIQQQNTRDRKDRRLSIILEWME